MIEKPHLNVIAMQAPANPIIDPIDKSNSPAIFRTSTLDAASSF